ncbi:MAG: hypothetical protein QG554_296, partial [Pseudomonadota bacterium]|nr:hypothetical protein [Pseudomonadota bacterium]
MSASDPSALPCLHRLGVVVEAPQHAGLWGPLDYLSAHALPAGTLVRVPFGRRVVAGVVWWGAGEVAPDATIDPTQLKEVIEVLDGLPPLPPAWRQLVRFAASYYQRSLGEMALMVLPPELRQLDATQWERRRKRLDKAVAPPPTKPKRARAKAAGVTEPSASEDLAALPPQVSVPVPPLSAPLLPTLTDEQQTVLDRLAEGSDQPYLLWGSTGSGKTEVYLRQAQLALDAGQQVLMMVPEINLTPQLETRVAERFAGRRIVSLHSGLTPAQRLRNWLMAHTGHADLILGTRLSVFTPLPRLGLIVVDEEHDPSYKQQDGARYSARDLAIYRAKQEQVPIILGSATPSLESWYNALPVAEGGAGR